MDFDGASGFLVGGGTAFATFVEVRDFLVSGAVGLDENGRKDGLALRDFVDGCGITVVASKLLGFGVPGHGSVTVGARELLSFRVPSDGGGWFVSVGTSKVACSFVPNRTRRLRAVSVVESETTGGGVPVHGSISIGAGEFLGGIVPAGLRGVPSLVLGELEERRGNRGGAMVAARSWGFRCRRCRSGRCEVRRGEGEGAVDGRRRRRGCGRLVGRAHGQKEAEAWGRSVRELSAIWAIWRIVAECGPRREERVASWWRIGPGFAGFGLEQVVGDGE